MDDARLTRLSSVLAVVAVVVVVVSTVVVGQRFTTRDTASSPTGGSTASSGSTPTGDPSTPPSNAVSYSTPSDLPSATVFPGGRIDFGGASRDAVLELPKGWKGPIDGYRGLEVGSRFKGTYPQVYDTSSVGTGWCAKAKTDDVAFVGWGPPEAPKGTEGDARAANTATITPWRSGFNYHVNRRYYFPPRLGAQRQVTLDDGTRAWRTTMTGAIREDDCPSVTAAVVTVVSFLNAGKVTTVIGYRDVGTSRDVSQAEIEKILDTARGYAQ